VQSFPELFSPAAALRPVCQDSVFPVAAQISGPGERAYLYQLGEVYELFGVSHSIPWPRASFTVIDPRTLRISEKEHISPEKLFWGIEHIRLERARDTFPEALQASLGLLENTVGESFDNVVGLISSLDPTLAASVQKDKSQTLVTVKKIRDRALRAHKEKLELKENRLASAAYFLMPDNGLQERWFGTDAILSLLDDTGFDELLNLTSPGEECHRIVMPDSMI
jgi:uncharacterized protein YllA (UPF0747 family)